MRVALSELWVLYYDKNVYRFFIILVYKFGSCLFTGKAEYMRADIASSQTANTDSGNRIL
jgi:hypothetical protein